MVHPNSGWAGESNLHNWGNLAAGGTADGPMRCHRANQRLVGSMSVLFVDALTQRE